MNEPKLDEAFAAIKEFIRINEAFDEASAEVDRMTPETQLWMRRTNDARLIEVSDQVDEMAAAFRKKFGRNIWPIYYGLGFK